MFEIWRAGGAIAGTSAESAQAAEAEGWDGQMFMDSQCLSVDPYVAMGAWAVSTSRLKLSTGVTNPATRNLAVTAAGAATVQALSGGRAVLGIGRGDSALAWLGCAPVGLQAFERALVALQALLRGEEIAFADSGERGEAPSHEGLSLGARPQSAKLGWLPKDLPKVPLDVAVTGPKLIAMAATLAERVSFSVGAQPESLQWALAQGRAARAAKGLGEDGVSWGAQILVVCHTDEEAALEVALRFAPPLARFQVMQSQAVPRGQGDAASLEAIHKGYDMTRHGIVEEKQRLTSGALSPDFVRRFAIVGNPEHCTQRLLQLRQLGLQRFVIVGPGFYPAQWGEAASLFAREVIPALRAAG